MANEETLRIGWGEAARALFKERGISQGLWKIGVALRYAAANTGPNDESMMPSGIVAIETIVLSPAEGPGPLVFDASDLTQSEKVRAKVSTKGRPMPVSVKKPGAAPSKKPKRQF